MKNVFLLPKWVSIGCICLFLNESMMAQQVLWDKYIGGNYQDYLADVVATGDNGFLLAGSSLSTSSGLKNSENKGGLDYWLWKMNEQGELDWQKSFGGNKTDMLHQVQHTKDGGFILVGTSDSHLTGDKKHQGFGATDIWVIKLNAKGIEEWQQTLGGSGYEDQPAIVQTKDGGYVMGCSSSSGISGNKTTENMGSFDYWLVKLNKKGEIDWQKSYGGALADTFKSIIRTAGEGFLIGGHSNSMASGTKTADAFGMHDYWLLKINAKGEIDWQKTIGSDKDEQLTALINTKDGNYIIGGSSNAVRQKKDADNRHSTAMHLMKIDPTGQTIWEEYYCYGKTNFLQTIIENYDGTLMVGGYAKGEFQLIDGDKQYKKNASQTDDFIVLKLDESGKLIWDKVIANEGEDILKKIITTADGSFVLAGTNNVLASRDKKIKHRQGSNDFLFVKMKDQSLPTHQLELLKAIPNPTEAFTNIIVGQAFSQGQLVVVDMMGRQVLRQTVDQRIIPLDMNGWQAGVYIANLQIGHDKHSVKIIKD